MNNKIIRHSLFLLFSQAVSFHFPPFFSALSFFLLQMLWTWCQSSTESLQAFGHCGNARKTLGTSNLDHRNPVVPVVLRMPQFLNGSKILMGRGHPKCILNFLFWKILTMNRDSQRNIGRKRELET